MQSYDISLVIRALEFAAQKHRMQRRKDSDASPYINHPIAVMRVLCIDGGVSEPTILAAAALHDTIEDTETSGEELEREFGPVIDPPPMKWSDSKYGICHRGGLQWRRSTSRKRSLRSCGRLMF